MRFLDKDAGPPAFGLAVQYLLSPTLKQLLPFYISREAYVLSGEAKGIHWIQLVGKPSLWDMSIPGNSFLAFRYSVYLGSG